MMDSPAAFYAAAAGVGIVVGSSCYSLFKAAQKEKGQREGFVTSGSTKLLCMGAGAVGLGAAITQGLGVHTLRDFVGTTGGGAKLGAGAGLLVWVPVIFEFGFLLVRNKIMGFLVDVVTHNKDGTTSIDKKKNKDSGATESMYNAKLLDRLKYSLYVVNVMLTAYIAGAAPERMYQWYGLKMAVLLPLRIMEFRQQRMHLYNYELCLFVNYAFLIYLFMDDVTFDKVFGLFFENRATLFAAIFGLANGPVGWYLVAFDGSLSFFDRGRTTSAFIHFAPPLTTYCLRHFGDTKQFPLVSESNATRVITVEAFKFYGAWLAFQYIVVLGVYYQQIKDRDLLCMFMEPSFDGVRRFSRKHSVNRFVYVIIHAVVASAVMAMSPLLYHSKHAHFSYLLLLAFTCIWNGSAETFERFKESYTNELKARLKIVDDEEGAVDPTIVSRLQVLVLEISGKKKGELTVEPNAGTLTDLGLDSMRVGMLGAKLQDEYSIYDLEVAELVSKNIAQIAKLVQDRKGKGSNKIAPCPLDFSVQINRPPMKIADGSTLAEIFLNSCDRMGPFAALADDSKPEGNVLAYKRLKIASLLIAQFIDAQKDLKGKQRVGVMLPASVGATVVTFGSLISGKVPVMINFTLGADKISHCVNASGINVIITSKKFVTTLKSKGVELPPSLGESFVFAEDIMQAFTTLDMAATALFLAKKSAKDILTKRFNNTHTNKDHAAILFTSGSTSNPKGVPLTNHNIIENLKAVVARATFNEDDIIMAALPPFHSFGFAATTCVPVLFGIRCVYYPNPTAFFDIARQMARWKPTIYLSTPSWMSKVYSSSTKNPEWTSSLRAVIVGAEACPQSLKDDCKKKKVTVIEGYGITETSPVLSTTVFGTESFGVGWPLDNIDILTVKLISYETAKSLKGAALTSEIQGQLKERQNIQKKIPASKGDAAALLTCRLNRPIVAKVVAADEVKADNPKEKELGSIIAAGPNVFGDPNSEAYLGHKVWELAKIGTTEYKFDPFVEYQGKVWYNTEDLGRFDSTVKNPATGKPALCIGGRLKRFVKRGGEMISLGAIEEPLASVFAEIDQKRTYAVESAVFKNPATGEEEPMIAVLLLKAAVQGGTKAEAMAKVKAALSAVFKGGALNLHMPDDIVFVDAVPMLGTGKLDLQGCKLKVADYYANKHD